MRSPLFFLVTFLAIFVTAKHHKKEKRPEDLIHNDRGKELNRDFTNMVQYGLIDGLFKYKMSGIPDCTAEGMTLMRSARRMHRKMQTDEYQEDDAFNLFQLWLAFSSRCNYFATV